MIDKENAEIAAFHWSQYASICKKKKKKIEPVFKLFCYYSKMYTIDALREFRLNDFFLDFYN